MLTQHIALVPEAGGVDLSELSRVSAALQKQVTRDLSPLWGMSATVDAFHELEDVPVGYWPIVISPGELQRAAGVHLDRNGQPYAHIALSPLWSVEASRACLEMLISPFGDRTTTAVSPRVGQGLVELLVEVCSPCCAANNGYAINGVLVSDFCTPAFFGASSAPGRERYSFNGSIAAPLQLLRGGYLTWYEPSNNEWWMRVLPSNTPIDLSLGSVEQSSFGARDLVRRRGPARLWSGGASSGAMLVHTRRDSELSQAASRNRAFRLRSLLGQRLEESLSAALDAGDETEDSALDADRWANPTVLLTADSPQQANSADIEDVVELTPEPATTVYQLRNLESDGEPLEVAEDAPRQPSLSKPAAPKRTARSTNPPPLPPQRVSRPSEVARARRALPAENRSTTAYTTAARAPSSIPPVEVLSTLASARPRHDALLVATGAVAAAALFGLIWTQPGDTASATARPGLPSAVIRAEPPAVQPPATPLAQPPVAPTPAAGTPVRPAKTPLAQPSATSGPSVRASEERRRSTRPRPAREPQEPEVEPDVVEQHASALDKLIDTRR